MNNTLNLLGLARKASKLIIGTDYVLEKLSTNKIVLLIVASDASTSTIDKIENKGILYKIPVVKSFSSDELSNAIGLKNVKVLGLTCNGFKKSILSQLEKVESEINL